MSEKRNVQLQITSSSDGQAIEQSFIAELYAKSGIFYYRYKETDVNMGSTQTTIRVDPQEIRIIRHGDVQSEQSFFLQRHRSFNYQTPQGRLELATFTHEINLNLEDQLGTISWSYDLYSGDELSGTYSLTVKIADLN